MIANRSSCCILQRLLGFRALLCFRSDSDFEVSPFAGAFIPHPPPSPLLDPSSPCVSLHTPSSPLWPLPTTRLFADYVLRRRCRALRPYSLAVAVLTPPWVEY